MKAIARNAYRALMRLVTPNSGLTRLAFNAPVNAMFAGTQAPMRGTTRDGLVVEIDPHDYHGRILWLFGSNDIKVSRTVNALLSPGDVFLDIGANYGTIGLAARHAVGPAGRVHLFEPQPHLAANLRRVLAQPGTEAVTLHPVALFDADGEMTLSVPAGHSGRATLVADLVRGDATADWTRVAVPVHRTARFLPPLLDGRPFGVKIDIEGAEPPVIKDILALPRLKFVVFEGDRNERVLFDLFSGAGFAVFGLARTLLSPKVEHVADFARWHDFHDFVAVPAAAATGAVGRIPLADLARRCRARPHA